MLTLTDSALETRKSRKIQDAIDLIISSIKSFCNNKDKQSLMQVVLYSPTLRNTLVSVKYIKNDYEAKMALKNVHHHNRILACASNSTGKTGRETEEKSSFVNSVSIANTSTTPLDGSKTYFGTIEEVTDFPLSRSFSYRRLKYARKSGKILISGSGVYEWSGKKYGRFTENSIQRS